MKFAEAQENSEVFSSSDLVIHLDSGVLMQSGKEIVLPDLT